MPPNRQYEVLSRSSQCLARMIERHGSEALGRKMRVSLEASEDARKKADTTVLLVDMRATRAVDREYENFGGEEQFRNPPIVFSPRYLVSAWAKPPEDQAIIGAVMRTFLDYPVLELEDPDDDMIVGYTGAPGIDLVFPSLEDHSLMAKSLGIPVVPSLTYSVTLKLRSAKVTPIKRVIERVTDFRNINS